MRKALCLAALALCLSGNTVRSAGLDVVGTGDGMELLQSIANAYNRHHNVNAINVPPSIGSGGAVFAVGAERTSLGRIARPLADKEKAQGLIEVPIMKIPSAIYIHPSARVSELNQDQLVRIYSGEIQNWSEVGGANLRVRVVRREEADSTLSVLRVSMPGWKTLQITKRSKLAMTTQEAVETVTDVEGAIGFGPYSKMLEANATILRIDGKYPLDEAYPSAVTLSLLYKEGKLTPEAKQFIEFVRSEIGRELIAQWGGVPML